MNTTRLTILAVVTACAVSAQTVRPDPDISVFFHAAAVADEPAKAALDKLAASWRPAYGALLLDIARLLPRHAPSTVAVTQTAAVPAGSRPPAGPPPPAPPFDLPPLSPPARARARIIAFLEKQTGKQFGGDVWSWREWFWKQPYDPHPDYASFKRVLYERLDPKFADFFPPGVDVRIRLDEVDWGGVKVDGIPSLDHPKTIGAGDASYLADDHIVFGVVSGGEARAYPKRILAWHELVRDTIGGTHVTVVYCTLCGTVIPYISEAGGLRWTFGTSGLLYRSNKLMFDAESKSLWSTLEGVPVIGPLASRGLQLERLPVVTTTWGEWKAAHPRTTVLSPDTGHQRDYREGAAYKDYFATDDLMFRVAERDHRLKNKAEVLALLVRDEAGVRHPIALAADFLHRRPVHQFSAGGRHFVVVTTGTGANRVYEASAHRFTAAGGARLKDERGATWRQTEEALICEGVQELPLRRVPAHRVFWFAWYAQFPATMLIR